MKKEFACGFTFLELLIVLGLGVIIAVFTIPVGLNFYKLQVLDDTSEDILQVVRRAHHQAFFQKLDSNFGVKFFSDSYVLFQGNSYDTRVLSEDEFFSLPAGMSPSGMSEVVFEKLSGIPTTTGSLTLTSDGNTRILTINVQGKIEKE